MKGCLFCEIASGKRDSRRVFEDEHCFAFHDVNPQAPIHVLVIPKEHLTSLNDIEKAKPGLFDRLMKSVQEIAARLDMDRKGYRVVINTGPDGGQTVYHLHIHLLGGRQLHWPPG